MKHLWKKIPAWLKAILLNLVLAWPIILINQSLIQLNMKVGTQFGWSLLPIVGVLAIFWYLVTKFNPFKSESAIQIELKFDVTDTSTVASIVGLVFTTLALIMIGFNLSSAETPERAVFFRQFLALGPLTAIPLLLGLAIHAGLVEEVVSRGYMQNTMGKYPKAISYLFIGIIFAVSHFLPWQLIIPYTLVSIAFSFVADKHKSIGAAIFAHALVDFIFFVLQYVEVISESTFEGNGILIVSFLLLVIGVAAIVYTKKQSTLQLA